MDEKRILEIFWGYVNNNPADEALFSTVIQIKKEILTDILSGTDPDKEKLRVVLKISDAHTKIGYFIQDPVTIITKAQRKYFEHLEFLFKAVAEGCGYIRDNYELMGTESFRKNNPKSEIENSIKTLSDENDSTTFEFITNGSVSISREQIMAIKRMLEKMLLVIIGWPAYDRLTEESTKAYPIITRYQLEIRDNKNSRIH
ncbi:MAG: hypothetical protein Q8R55_02610 [Candidatus Taylorbacteria bacterium]|nr:hypothetical protein [Candidatus Taylorbacteria bacterium]